MGYVGEEEIEMMEVRIEKSVVRADLYYLRDPNKHPTGDTDYAMSGDWRCRFGNHQSIELELKVR